MRASLGLLLLLVCACKDTRLTSGGCREDKDCGSPTSAYRCEAQSGLCYCRSDLACPGSQFCNGIGFRGRVGIFEMMIMNSEIRTLAFDRAPTNKVRKAAMAGGMKNLLQDGRLKVLNGVTTAEEIVKVAQIEGVVTT
jgi:type II secretory ATPase GspE/PulE/Tfp pilus assembly ATPase PilB-like protein